MDVKSIAVIGGGTMGSGIALTAATHGFDTTLIDISEEQLQRASGYHAKQLARSVEKGRMSQEDADAATSRLSYAASMTDASGSDWAVEAVTENPETKKAIFKEMCEAFGIRKFALPVYRPESHGLIDRRPPDAAGHVPPHDGRQPAADGAGRLQHAARGA